MRTKNFQKFIRHAGLVFCILLTPMLLTASSLILQQSEADASSHREAPLISQDAYADNTDTYVFISPTNPDNVVLVASWIPFEGPEGGPNYFEWGNGVLYDINVDNDGDAVADYTYRLSSEVQLQNPLTFLYNDGPIDANGSNWNRQQRYTVQEISEEGTETLLDNVLAPPVNIGSKSTPDYESLADNFIYTVGDNGDEMTIYAGQTDDAFWVDLQVFDLVTLRGQSTEPLKAGGPPLGYATGNNIPVDSVAGFNVHSLVIEVPIDRLTSEGEPVLGVWATASRPAMRVLNGPGGLGSLTNSGEPVQVSRLGMPLTNEVVLPYALKDAFNSIPPSVDAVLYTGGLGDDIQQIIQTSVENPELGRLLCGFYGVPLPGDSDSDCNTDLTIKELRSGRGDIFDIFLTGMVLADQFMIQTANGPVLLDAGTNINRPANVVPADMIRINTAIKGDLCSPKPSRLGVFGADACGFPNGRRLIDDVVEIEILAVAGAGYQVLDGRDEGFQFNPALIDILTDGIDFNDVPFRTGFPYMATAQSGQEHIHTNPVPDTTVIRSVMTLAKDSADDAEERVSSGKVRISSRDLELGKNGSKPQIVGVRFPNLHVPAGATILSAYVEFTAEEDDDTPTTFVFRGEATGNAAPFAEETNNITNRTMTDAEVTWTDVPDWVEDQRYWSPNLAPIVEAIVNGEGWASGNALAIIITGTEERSAWSVDGKPGDAPMLYVEYSMDSSVTAASLAPHAEENTVRSTVSSTVLRGTERGAVHLPDDDVEEVAEELSNAQEAYLPVVKNE